MSHPRVASHFNPYAVLAAAKWGSIKNFPDTRGGHSSGMLIVAYLIRAFYVSVHHGPRKAFQPNPDVALVTKDWESIKDLPDKRRTPDVCLAAVRRNGWAIEYLTPEERTPEARLTAVQEHGHIIWCLTPEERTPDVCLAAVQHNSTAMSYLVAKGPPIEPCTGCDPRAAI